MRVITVRVLATCLLFGMALAQAGTGSASARTLAVPPGYSVTLVEMADEPGGYSLPNAINARGGVAANWYGQGPIKAMYSRKGSSRILSKEGETGLPQAINKDGAVAGVVMAQSGDTYTTNAVLWKDEEEIILPTLGGDIASAWGMNDAELIVGVSAVTAGDDPDCHATTWQDGVASDLGTLPGGGNSAAIAVNATGAIVGGANVAPGGSCGAGNSFRDQFLQPGVHAVQWIDGTPADLGILPGGDASLALDINDEGDIVGIATVAGGATHAVLWRDGEITDLSPLPGVTNSAAYGINNEGQIVGYSDNPDGEESGTAVRLAVLWDGDEIVTLQDLMPDGEGWTAEGAGAINDNGQITIHGYNDNVGTFGYYGAILNPLEA